MTAASPAEESGAYAVPAAGNPGSGLAPCMDPAEVAEVLTLLAGTEVTAIPGGLTLMRRPKPS